MNKDNLQAARQKRGQIDTTQLLPFTSFSDDKLINLLQSETPTDRTIGAILLGKRKVDSSVKSLCKALKTEKSLYSKIAICQALENIGESSIDELLKLVGAIGKNQETDFPIKYFEKKSFPLVRDIVSRTIIGIEKPAIDPITALAETPDKYLLSQVIDILGGLLSKTKEDRILDTLITVYSKEKENKFLLWKTIRALSAVKNPEIPPLIISNLKDPTPAIVWETIRTIGLTSHYDAHIINKLDILTDNNQIKQAKKDAIKRIEQRKINY